MGPAHLNDVVGMDTGVHVAKTICAGFPQRLRRTWKDPLAFADQEIIERMMLPLLIEAARCLEEAIVASASELDLALVLGLGFPAYLGGALKYADWLGPGAVVELSDRYADLGPQYIVTPTLRAIARSGDTFYGRN